jgi:hypothetical protein
VKELPHKVGERMFLAAGGYLESEIEDPLRLSKYYSRTALHESRHANAAPEKMVEASIEPDANSTGHVLFTEHDDIAAAAALAYDMPGTGFDEWTIQGNVNAAASGARTVLDGQQENVVNFARFLEANRNADRADLMEVRNRTEMGNIIHLRVVTSEGIRRYETRAGIDEEHVMIPGEWVELSRAA